MTSFRRFLRLCAPCLAYVAGSGLLVLSAFLLRAHALSIRQMQEETFPLMAKTATLEERLSLLQRQVEVTRLNHAEQTGTLQEKLRAYVLPAGSVDRTVTTLTAIVQTLKQEGRAKDDTPIRVGEVGPAPHSGTGGTLQLTERSVTFALTVREDAASELLGLLDISGLLTVRDALDASQIKDLFSLTESENPTGIVSLGQYLSADLFAYVRDTRVYDERLLTAFSSEAFAALLKHVETSASFRSTRALLSGPLGSMLTEQKLWPLPFLTVEQASTEELSEGWVRLTVTLGAYGRT